MTQAHLKSLTVDEFILQYGDHDRYELIDREIFDLEPTGLHEEVTAFALRKINVEIDRSDLAWFAPSRCLIKLLGTNTAFRPDVIVLDKVAIESEPLWKNEPIITLGTSIRLIVEVVSQNWQNDYARKAEDYRLLGIPEYWILDYPGLGSKEYLGEPKQPTVSIYTLIGKDYQKRLFRGSERLISPTFPNLRLTAEQILLTRH
jgi:Uma2 family endonuclease